MQMGFPGESTNQPIAAGDTFGSFSQTAGTNPGMASGPAVRLSPLQTLAQACSSPSVWHHHIDAVSHSSTALTERYNPALPAPSAAGPR